MGLPFLRISSLLSLFVQSVTTRSLVPTFVLPGRSVPIAKRGESYVFPTSGRILFLHPTLLREGLILELGSRSARIEWYELSSKTPLSFVDIDSDPNRFDWKTQRVFSETRLSPPLPSSSSSEIELRVVTSKAWSLRFEEDTSEVATLLSLPLLLPRYRLDWFDLPYRLFLFLTISILGCGSMLLYFSRRGSGGKEGDEAQNDNKEDALPLSFACLASSLFLASGTDKLFYLFVSASHCSGLVSSFGFGPSLAYVLIAEGVPFFVCLSLSLSPFVVPQGFLRGRSWIRTYRLASTGLFLLSLSLFVGLLFLGVGLYAGPSLFLSSVLLLISSPRV